MCSILYCIPYADASSSTTCCAMAGALPLATADFGLPRTLLREGVHVVVTFVRCRRYGINIATGIKVCHATFRNVRHLMLPLSSGFHRANAIVLGSASRTLACILAIFQYGYRRRRFPTCPCWPGLAICRSPAWHSTAELMPSPGCAAGARIAEPFTAAPFSKNRALWLECRSNIRQLSSMLSRWRSSSAAHQFPTFAPISHLSFG